MQETIRCSALPRIISCPASMIEPEVRINTDSAAAQMGTAFHAFMAAHIDGPNGESPEYYLRQTMGEPSDEQVDEAYFLARRGQVIWDTFAAELQNVRTELAMETVLANGARLSGHLDVIGCRGGDEADRVIIDWKTGRSERSFRNQLLGYALLDYTTNGLQPDVRYKIITAYPRYGNWDVDEIEAGEIMAFAERLDDICKVPPAARNHAPSVYNCQYCPRAHECPARNALIKSALAAFTDPKTTIMNSRDRLIAAFPKYKALTKVVDEFKEALRFEIEAHGPLDLEDGTKLSFKEYERETILYSNKMMDLCNAAADGLDWNAILTVKSKALFDAVGKAAGRGKGKAAKEAMNSILKESGCIETKTYTRMEVTK